MEQKVAGSIPDAQLLFTPSNHIWTSFAWSGWPANAMFICNRIREKQFFFTLPVVNDNEIVRTTSDGVEGIQV